MKKDNCDWCNKSFYTEKIADDYAIEFAEWLNSNCYRCFDNDWWLTKKEGDVKKTSKELLEIFKKEKGL